MTAEPQEYLFNVDEYYRMLHAGIFTEDDRVELIEGKIITMSPIGSRHSGCLKRLIKLLEGIGDTAIIGVQDPIHLDDRSEPQPDVSVLHKRADFYGDSHPAPKDIFLVIEVADSSMLFDRNVKIPLYLRSGIAEVWLVDLANDSVQRHTLSGVESFARGAIVSSVALPNLQLRVDDIIG